MFGGGRGEEEVFDGGEDEEEGGGLARVRWYTRPQSTRQTSGKCVSLKEVGVQAWLFQLEAVVKEDGRPVAQYGRGQKKLKTHHWNARVLGNAVPELIMFHLLECLGHGARERIR